MLGFLLRIGIMANDRNRTGKADANYKPLGLPNRPALTLKPSA
jgi:hypothetical protein